MNLIMLSIKLMINIIALPLAMNAKNEKTNGEGNSIVLIVRICKKISPDKEPKKRTNQTNQYVETNSISSFLGDTTFVNTSTGVEPAPPSSEYWRTTLILRGRL